jgi:hypothetical protein
VTPNHIAKRLSRRSKLPRSRRDIQQQLRELNEVNPPQMVQLDSPENKSLNLQCGDNAETFAIVGASEFIAAGTAQ